MDGLTKSLVEDLLSLIVQTKSVLRIFFAEKIVGSFCIAKATHIFISKNNCIFANITLEILMPG